MEIDRTAPSLKFSSSGLEWLISGIGELVHYYRVTKYDPRFRDPSGVYTRDEWTRYSEVGTEAGGVLLTLDDYLRVESAYLQSLAHFLREDGILDLVAVGVENTKRSANAPIESQRVPVAEVAAFCRGILREEYWCRLEAGDRFVNFGWDYYMYLGLHNECPKSCRFARLLGLFVEPFASPYLAYEEEAT